MEYGAGLAAAALNFALAPQPPYYDSMKRVLVTLLSLLLALPAPLLSANPVNLPDLGDSSAAVISPMQERKLGEDVMRKARRNLDFLDDAEINTYIQTLGQRLVARSDAPSQEFRFFVVADPTINAFAIPGGFIGVHTGLLLATQSEGELASVLAHEIAHITQRHYPRMLAEAQRSSLPTMAAMLAAIVLASAGHKGGDAALAMTAATSAQHEINFTRAHEEEADRIGTRVLAEAGFDPRAMPSFFERMQALNRHNETNLPKLLLTHPVTTARISDSRARAEQYTYRQIPDSVDFHLARAKLRALAGEANEVARGFAQNLAEGRGANMDAERFGYAHALLRARRFDDARNEARKLTTKSPSNVSYRMLQAQIEVNAGRSDAGLAIYASTYRANPTHTPLAQDYARALLRANRARDAEPIIREALKTRREDPAWYALLAQAASANGKTAESHQALAEQRYLNGDPTGAIEQLRLASRYAGDNFYLQSSIDARIQAIREESALYQGKAGEAARSHNSHNYFTH